MLSMFLRILGSNCSANREHTLTQRRRNTRRADWQLKIYWKKGHLYKYKETCMFIKCYEVIRKALRRRKGVK